MKTIRKKLTPDEIKALPLPITCLRNGLNSVVIDIEEDLCTIKNYNGWGTLKSCSLYAIDMVSGNYEFDVPVPKMMSRYIFTCIDTGYTWEDYAYYGECGCYDNACTPTVFFDETKYIREKIGEEIPCTF